jgi:hypothetical protein
MKQKSHLLWFSITMLIAGVFTILGPSEATLGSNARVVYLHGAWVWVSLTAFITAGSIGLFGVIRQLTGTSSHQAHRWSRAFGRTGLTFWVTYIPLSMWAMQTNWNGLFLAEPRWRFAIVFAIGGALLQLGLSFLPVSWASFWNLAYVIILFIVLGTTDNVMHPPSPMLDSNAWRIQTFFGGLIFLLMLASWQLFQWFKTREP